MKLNLGGAHDSRACARKRLEVLAHDSIEQRLGGASRPIGTERPRTEAGLSHITFVTPDQVQLMETAVRLPDEIVG